jgi:hypothetical protein
MKQRRLGDVIKARMGTDPLGRHFWFEELPGFSGKYAPPGTMVYGPFATRSECEENQRLVLLNSQCEVVHGGNWDPAWDRKQ